MKTNEIIAHVNTRIEARNAAIASAEVQLSDTQSADEALSLKDTISEHKHAIRFLTVLLNDETAQALSSAKISAESLLEIERDAKSLAKLAELCRAVKFEREISMSNDDALAQAVKEIAQSNFAQVTAEHLRKRILSKRSNYTIAHSTKRQAQMILNLFMRLNAASKVDRETYSFDASNYFMKKLSKIYTAQ